MIYFAGPVELIDPQAQAFLKGIALGLLLLVLYLIASPIVIAFRSRKKQSSLFFYAWFIPVIFVLAWIVSQLLGVFDIENAQTGYGGNSFIDVLQGWVFWLGLIIVIISEQVVKFKLKKTNS